MTLEPVRLRLLLIGFAAAALTVGCGDGNALQSPTGPSDALASSTFLTGDSADGAATASTAGEFDTLDKGGKGNGNGNGGGNGNGKGKDKDKSGHDDSTGKPDENRAAIHRKAPVRDAARKAEWSASSQRKSATH
jgi:hypothetical protein